MIFAKKKKTKNIRYIDCNLGVPIYIYIWVTDSKDTTLNTIF